jgi:hypothetical protein
MKRAIAVAIASVAVAAASPALANDMSGRFGLGANQSLLFKDRLSQIATAISGTPIASGLSARYQASPTLGLEGIVSYLHLGGDPSLSIMILSLRSDVRLLSSGNSTVNAIGGLGLTSSSGGGNSETDVGLEAGVRAEHFFTPSFSVHMEAGLVLAFFATPGLSLNSQGNDGTTLSIGRAAPFGGAGFAFWFGGGN